MQRPFTRFVGVDLGGGRGKTTALAEIRNGVQGAEVIEVSTRSAKQPWTDDTLMAYLQNRAAPGVVVAIDAPLTQTACGRCEIPVCPGMEVCSEPAVVWLRTEGRALIRKVAVEAVNGRTRTEYVSQARLAPYAHRATEVILTYERGLLPLAQLGTANGTIAARANQLKRRMKGVGFTLHENLLEVSPAATVAALCGVRASRGYKRDADPWRTRAVVLEKLSDSLSFAPQSRMAREEVLGNDNAFDAVISAYTAFLWARDGWTKPDTAAFDTDGWIYTPPSG
ncbi:MAG: DUF429 domain-containing protein [Kofleriaceae bacterium]